jgi:hypothetical protein
MASVTRRIRRNTTRPKGLSRAAHDRHSRVIVAMSHQAQKLNVEGLTELRANLMKQYRRSVGDLKVTFGLALNRLPPRAEAT